MLLTNAKQLYFRGGMNMKILLNQKAYFNGIDVTVKEKEFSKGEIQNGKN